jgi:hypothetical protein
MPNFLSQLTTCEVVDTSRGPAAAQRRSTPISLTDRGPAGRIKLDEVRKRVAGRPITYITDLWRTRMESVERAHLGPEVSTK